MELESRLEDFKKQGLGVAAVSYDTVEILSDFARRRNITLPLLSDPESKVIRDYGLLNELDYPKGAFGHGVPYPGTFVADRDGIIRSKSFEKAYAERRTAGSILASLGKTAPASATELRTEQLTLKWSASNTSVAPGQRVSLLLDFEMAKGMHAYAPGEHRYRALSLTFDPHPLVTVHPLALPRSRPYTFAPLGETVPVFEGSFRVMQDVTIASLTPLMREALNVESASIELRAVLSYQVCSHTICYAPARAPLTWTLKLVAPDRERAPEALRKKPGP